MLSYQARGKDSIHNHDEPENCRYIHQIWFDLGAGPVPPENMKKNMDLWKTHADEDGWTYILWNERTALSFLRQYYSFFLKTYEGYPYGIQRVDALRYFILYHYGGVYADTDMFPRRKWSDAVRGISSEKYSDRGPFYICESPNVVGDNYVSNALMYSTTKKHPFLKRLFNALRERAREDYWFYPRHYFVMYSTGPKLVGDYFRSHGKLDGVYLLPSKMFNPCGTCIDGKDGEKIIEKNNPYTIHKNAGSWEDGDSKILVKLYCQGDNIIHYGTLTALTVMTASYLAYILDEETD